MTNTDYILKLRPSQFSNVFYYLFLAVIFSVLLLGYDFLYKYLIIAIYHLNDLVFQKDAQFVRNLSIAPFFLILFSPVFFGLYRLLATHINTYFFYNDRLVFFVGVLNRYKETIEYYRVKDHYMNRPLHFRLLGLSTMTVISTDRRNPKISLNGFRKIYDFEPEFRRLIEQAKDDGKGREIDVV